MINGELVSLRAANNHDMEISRIWSNDEEIAAFVDRARPVSEIEHVKWWENIVQNQNICFFAVEDCKSKEHIGNIWLYDIDCRHRKAELRVLIGDKRYWSKGYGREAVGLLVEFAFKKLNLNKVYAYVLASNPRAKKMFESCGFVVEGELISEYFCDGKYENGCRLAALRKGL